MQFWRSRPKSGEILMLSMLVFAVAAMTFDHRWIQFLAPAYFAMLALALRQFRPRPLAAARHRWRRRIVRLAALAAALAIGASIGQTLHQNSDSLHRLFRQQRNIDVIALSQAPRLTSSSGMRPLLGRVLRIRGPLGEAHLRAMTFDTYQNGLWGPPAGSGQFTRITPEQLKGDAAGPRLIVSRVAQLRPAPRCSTRPESRRHPMPRWNGPRIGRCAS